MLLQAQQALITKIASWSIKPVCIGQLGPGCSHLMQEQVIISCKVLRNGQQLRVKSEHEVCPKYQEILAYSLVHLLACAGYGVLLPALREKVLEEDVRKRLRE